MKGIACAIIGMTYVIHLALIQIREAVAKRPKSQYDTAVAALDGGICLGWFAFTIYTIFWM